MRVLAELVVVLGGFAGVGRMALGWIRAKQRKKTPTIESMKQLESENEEMDQIIQRINSKRRF